MCLAREPLHHAQTGPAPPCVTNDPTSVLAEIGRTVGQTGSDDLLRCILDHGLGPLWYEILQNHAAVTPLFPGYSNHLKTIYLHNTANYLRQEHILAQTEKILSINNIPHAVFKGVHTREILYPDPAVRYACDILIAKADTTRAIKSLVAADFTFHPIAKNISHEGHITKDQTNIDLHWDIFRPGRTRIDLTDDFLKNKKQSGNHWYLDNEATLFIMLAHPVFTKYSTTPHASLNDRPDPAGFKRRQSTGTDWRTSSNVAASEQRPG